MLTSISLIINKILLYLNLFSKHCGGLLLFPFSPRVAVSVSTFRKLEYRLLRFSALQIIVRLSPDDRHEDLNTNICETSNCANEMEDDVQYKRSGHWWH